MTTLRRTFRYPDDNDSNSEPEAMDEEGKSSTSPKHHSPETSPSPPPPANPAAAEQESLIRTLAAENASRDALTTRVLTILPILACPPYILPTPFRPAAPLLRLLCATCLLSTAYLIHRLDPTQTGIPLLDSRHPGRNASKNTRSRPGLGGNRHAGAGPLDTYLPYLNGALAVLLVVAGVLVPAQSSPAAPLLSTCLPAVVYAVVALAKVVMAGVDPEAELQGLRYQYKGA